MKIMVTGADGFIGKNLIAELRNRGYDNLCVINRTSDQIALESGVKECEFIFHLAGINRPADDSEFMEGNFDFTSTLVELLRKSGKNTPIVFSSSIQANQDHAYGVSKKLAEDVLFTYSRDMSAKVMVYRLPNVFGKWCKPNYNSVVATFSYNIARELGIRIHNADAAMTLCYIDDVIDEFLKAMSGAAVREGDFFSVTLEYKTTVGELANKLYSFYEQRDTLVLPSLADRFDQVLYATFLTYLPEDAFSYRLNKKEDGRGWLAEFMKSDSYGQIFISKTKPGVTRGNHWHHTKVEKFLVVQGNAVVRFRKVDADDVLEYLVSGEALEVLDIPAGYIHSISNTGTEDLVTLFWASEVFDPDQPDTFYSEV